jgi:putative SOS response-associated peptidase YedK
LASLLPMLTTSTSQTGGPPSLMSDQLAPFVRNSADGERELVMARWGMPGPLQFGGQPVTNIRNVASPHWRGWLSARNRCLVPATPLCEYAQTKPRKTPTWFALSRRRRGDCRASTARRLGAGVRLYSNEVPTNGARYQFWPD